MKETGQVFHTSLVRVKLLGGSLAYKSRCTCRTGGLASATAVPLGGLFIIAVTLYVPDKPFLFAHLLEALHHLLNRFTRTRPYFNHKTSNLSRLLNAICCTLYANLNRLTGENQAIYIIVGLFQTKK